ncbi:MAG TPA: AMIN domain-containing protein [Desulfuromonadales bacterium]|nr:AMIN domain-containing protein [Desulfuromonadales bacterium]
MKMMLSTAIWMFLLLAYCSSDLLAAELLDVNPVVTGGNVSVEVTADVPMTYTYYKIPGQARAVVDIAEADPEKVEPLIVVNKGVVSSISVDKAQIAGMVVSRLIFNLVTESDIAVTASADRKHLTVTFGHAATAGIPSVKSQPVAIVSPSATSDSGTTAPPKPVDVPPAAVAVLTAAASTAAPAVAPPPPARIAVSEPVVPTDTPPAAASIKSIVIGDTYLEIQTDRAIADYKTIALKKPERLALDLPGARSTLSTKSVAINKFGISALRIGLYPAHIRIVLDASGATFPKHAMTATRNGIRITFK